MNTRAGKRANSYIQSNNDAENNEISTENVVNTETCDTGK